MASAREMRQQVIDRSRMTSAWGCYRFWDVEHAKSFADRCEKPMSVVLGDDDYWYVVTRAMGETLHKAGWVMV